MPTQEKESIYFLNAGPSQAEHNRLNQQHHIFNDIMQGDLLPPHITTALSQSHSPKILEIATGTAIWLTELSKTLPSSAELTGLDYDTSKFPSDLPPNITLRQADMYEPFPSDLLGKFDVVNVRLIIFALQSGRGVELARNLMTLLKPGGYIVVSAIEPPSQVWFEFQNINYNFAKKVGRDLNLPIGMLHYIKEAGYVECDDKAYPGMSQLYTDKGKDWIKRTNDLVILLFLHTLGGIVSLGGIEGMSTQEEADEMVERAKKEFGNRKLHYLFVRAWGRKPYA